ncbi:MAG: hypothetical protein ACI9EW_002424 [Cellvibrionaceae bacterium]|jgi:hypothetical protein
MVADDRVLVAYVPQPTDFSLLQAESWYRIPYKYAPKGLYSEYIAFYFGRRFGDQKWAIHYFAENRGHELVRRIDLIPDEPNHKRAQDIYYRVQLGPLQKLHRPIISLQWRRILFVHTTGDRFTAAAEINDLLLDGDTLVDRQFTALNETQQSGNYRIAESANDYQW